jgi:hypothetical protein
MNTPVMAERIARESPRQGQDYRCPLSPHHTDGKIRPGFRERQACGRRRHPDRASQKLPLLAQLTGSGVSRVSLAP